MKILVVDDHPLVLDALRLIVKKLERTVEVFSARSRDECLTQLRKVRDVDLMLLDLGGPGADGFSALREVRQAHPEIPLVVVSATDDSGTINEAIGLGAMGFIPKSSSPEVMLSALRLVLSGGIYLPPAALAARAQRRSGATARAAPFAATLTDIGLTPRQSEVLSQLLQGKPNKLICRSLGLAEGTVKIHVASILRAVGVSTRMQLLVEASKRGWRIDELNPM